ncbi:MAG: hypothetical protein AAB961_00765, partial [Patescibacteria group bacterium]
IGEGLVFAGPAHAAVRVIASPDEHELATTKPQEVEARDKRPAGTVPIPQKPLQVGGRQLPISNRPIFTVESVNS